MNTFAFALVISLCTVTLIAILLVALPTVSRPTLPLGVSVPQSRLGEPVIRASVQRFRLLTGAAWAVSVAITVVLSLVAPPAATVLPTLLFTGLGVLAYVLARRPIMTAKRDGRWFDGVPVRLTAQLTPQSHRRPPLAWALAGWVALLVVAGIGIALYPTLPNPLPVHWNANGIVDRYLTKSIGTVFAPLFIGFGMVALLFACSFLVRFSRIRAVPSDEPESAERRTSGQQTLLAGMLGQLALLVALLICSLTLIGWLLPHNAVAIPITVVVFLALLALVLLVFVLRYRRIVAPPGARVRTGAADAPDDDRYWRGGLVYLNREDPAFLVPKRFGVGWTLNFGNPLAILAACVLLALVVGVLVLAIVASGSKG